MSISIRIASLVGVVFLQSAATSTQVGAVDSPARISKIQYLHTDSGGLVRMVFTTKADSLAIDDLRRILLEDAAAIRRGAYQSVRVLRGDRPEAKVIEEKREHIRCIFRPLSRGGEIMLRGADESVVAMIHKLLSLKPPKIAR